ncbi:MAG: hypothetical protein ACFFC7_24130 [Candidatus Hermodarchaeota archaeon]
MKQSLLILGFLIITICIWTMPLTYSPVPVLSKVPAGAQWFYLDSISPVELFSLANFTNQSFIGYYNMEIECLLFLHSSISDCEVICCNIWNASDPPIVKTWGPHSTYSYSYSRPTADDPDFAVSITLISKPACNNTNGWILLQIKEFGTTDRPPDFIMPEHRINITCTSGVYLTTSGLNASTGTQPVFFLTIFITIPSLCVLLLWKKRNNLDKASNP